MGSDIKKKAVKSRGSRKAVPKKPSSDETDIDDATVDRGFKLVAEELDKGMKGLASRGRRERAGLRFSSNDETAADDDEMNDETPKGVKLVTKKTKNTVVIATEKEVMKLKGRRQEGSSQEVFWQCYHRNRR